MDAYYTKCLVASVCILVVSCSFVPITNEPQKVVGWAYNYDAHGIAAMRNAYRLASNDTCHVFKLTPQQRHDIHTAIGEYNVQMMMYQNIITQHGIRMTKAELNATSPAILKFCSKTGTFMKYNFYR